MKLTSQGVPVSFWGGIFFSCLLLLAAFSLHAQEPAAADMILIEGGNFQMGDRTQNGRTNELPLRNVTVGSFYLSAYEVAYEDFLAYSRATWVEPPESYGWEGAGLPVVGVSWFEAVRYCNWLSGQQGLSPCYEISAANEPEAPFPWRVRCRFEANGYRLPTEAEWEFAARGGSASRGFVGSGGDEVDKIGWHFGNAVSGARARGKLVANELGLFDMSGNAAEWCWDVYEPVYNSGQTYRPTGPADGELRVVRGGSWYDPHHELRASARRGFDPRQREQAFIGFRLARSR